MTRHQKAASRAVAAYLKDKKEPVLLYDVSCAADTGAHAAGRKTELFPTLWDYPDLLPAGWLTKWLAASDAPGADSMAFAVPPGWESGQSASKQLLLGGGKLVEANNEMFKYE